MRMSSAFLAAVLGACATSPDRFPAAGATSYEDPAVGSPAPQSVGEYLDHEAEDLQEIADARRTETGILVNLDSAAFSSNSATILRPAAVEQLAEVGDVLVKYPDGHIRIEGHMEATGSQAHEEQISFGRAAAVRDVLATRGVDRRRMYVEGMGAANPVADDSTPEGRANNCRVEIKIYGPVRGFVQDLVQR